MHDEVTTGLALLFAGEYRIDETGCWRWLGYHAKSGRSCWPKVFVTPETWSRVEVAPGFYTYTQTAKGPHHAAASLRRYVCMAKYGDAFAAHHDVFAMCGDSRCFNPDHLICKALEPKPERVPKPRTSRAKAKPVLVIGGRPAAPAVRA